MTSPLTPLGAEAVIQLASKSPRRRELLEQIGVKYSVVAIDVDEQRHSAELAADYVARLAREKARAGFERSPALPTLGSDTIVVVGSEILGKPKDQADARRMLSLLSGAEHQVYTSISLFGQAIDDTVTSVSRVRFRSISSDEIARYWQTGESRDKAGAYGIQGLGAVFVESLQGSYSGVMGLPLHELDELLRRHHIPCWQV